MHQNKQLSSELELLITELFESREALKSIKDFTDLIWNEVRRFEQSTMKTISIWLRQYADAWRCQIDQELFHNMELQVVAKKTLELLNSNNLNDLVRTNLRLLSKLDASIQDGDFGRYVGGFLPKHSRKKVFELDERYPETTKNLSNWYELETHYTNIQSILSAYIEIFPTTHAFSHYPTGIHHSLEKILETITEQIQIRSTIEILNQTFDDEELNKVGALLRYEIEMLKFERLPFPILSGDIE